MNASPGAVDPVPAVPTGAMLDFLRLPPSGTGMREFPPSRFHRRYADGSDMLIVP